MLTGKDSRLATDAVSVSPPDGDTGGDAPRRGTEATHRAVAGHGRQTVHEGCRPEDTHQEAEETELGKPEVRAGAPEQWA